MAKERFITLKVSPSFLKSLPQSTTNSPKKEQPKNTKKALPQKKLKSLVSSPALTPDSPGLNPSTISGNANIANATTTKNNLPRSQLSASANGGLLELDRSGKPVTKWLKVDKEIKTFSGFKINFQSWKPEPIVNKSNSEEVNKITTIENEALPNIDSTPLISNVEDDDIKSPISLSADVNLNSEMNFPSSPPTIS